MNFNRDAYTQYVCAYACACVCVLNNTFIEMKNMRCGFI